VKVAILFLIAVLATACSQSGGGGGGKSPAPGLDPAAFSDGRSCVEFINDLPKDYFHDWVTVSETLNDLSSPQIKIFYYGKISDRNNIIAFYNGGPASNSHGSQVAFEDELKDPARAGKYSFIYIDQRGTGCF
jgi:hypothetical protein